MKRLAIASGILYAFGTGLAGSTATPTDPKIDMMVRPVPVAVTNWPVLQNVAGTLNIANWPAVQAVSGSVSVENLPLADDGSLRVSTGTARQPRVVQLIDAPIVVPDGGNFISDAISVAGYSRILIRFDDAAGPYVTAYAEWRFDSADTFQTVTDRTSAGQPCFARAEQGSLCQIVGLEMRLHFYSSATGGGPGWTVNSAKAYLFP